MLLCIIFIKALVCAFYFYSLFFVNLSHACIIYKRLVISLAQSCLQMHGYDIHGPPPPMTRLDIDPGPVDMMHPDSTDSFVTYLESDDSLHNDTSSP